MEESDNDELDHTGGLQPAVRAALQAFVARCRDYAFLEGVLGIRPAELTVRYEPEHFSAGPEEQGELVAAQERRRLGLGQAPVHYLPEVLERQNVKVLVDSRPDAPHLAAASLYRQEFGHALLVNVFNARFPPARLNFPAAHAYAHLLFDKEFDIVEYNNFLEDARPMERRANAFAMAFLMPRELLHAELETLGWRSKDALGQAELVHLAVRLGVTYSALVKRLHRLGIISEDAKLALERAPLEDVWEKLRWRAPFRAAVEDWIVHRQSGRLRLLAAQAYRRGLIDASRASEIAGMAPGDFARYAEQGWPTVATAVPGPAPDD